MPIDSHKVMGAQITEELRVAQPDPELRAQIRQHVARDAPQEIRLVLSGIAATADAHVFGGAGDPRIVTGRDGIAAELARAPQQVGDLRIRVAAHARIGRAARAVVVEKMPEHALAVLGGSQRAA